jgi:hypothetical protein
MAQDALSAILPSPYTARLGSQLVYFWEEGTSATGRTPFKSFLTITNANITLTVTVHFQIYQVITSTASGGFTCLELFDWIDVLTRARDTLLILPISGEPREEVLWARPRMAGS